jgi:hypothetical protein
MFFLRALKIKMEVSVKSLIRVLSLSSIICAVSGSAMAVGVPPNAVTAPGPEIGDGVVGAAVATVALLGFVLLPRLKRLLQSKQG